MAPAPRRPRATPPEPSRRARGRGPTARIISVRDGCELTVRLQPRARANEIVGEREGAVLARVTAAAVDGRANDALCRLIAKRARVGVRRVAIVRGARAREKVVRVQGLGPKELREALALPDSAENET